MNSSSSSVYHHHNQYPPPSFLNHEGQLSDLLLVPPPVSSVVSSQHQALLGTVLSRNGEPSSLRNNVSLPEAKKDRHSKILTAQGLRDRRVRLSIGIARRFFDLQDMLGFDRASKTLEWLLSKSTDSIKKLARTKHINNSNQQDKTSPTSSSSSGSGGSSCSGFEYEVMPKKGKVKKAAKSISSKKRTKTLNVDQSRAEPRARARERTQEKFISNCQFRASSAQSDGSAQNPLDSQSPNTIPASKNQALPLELEVAKQSVATMRKPSTSVLFNHHKNSSVISSSKDWNSNFSVVQGFLPDLSPQWEVNHAINVNLTTEFRSSTEELRSKPA
ncbi:hypothetical protein CDL15_Pgr027459 [Punica granatum]|nr:hypothetical protein CDL15_Pgr027459 [Punica granatum]PKI69909.1 hypothetical protein CRG98_009784 [Punica granatum]